MVNIGKLKQVMDMRKAAKKMQKSLGDELVVGEAAGGSIKVSMDGNQKITNVEIADELMSPESKDKVQGGIADAHKDAQKKLQQIMAAKVRAGELELPDFNN